MPERIFLQKLSTPFQKYVKRRLCTTYTCNLTLRLVHMTCALGAASTPFGAAESHAELHVQ